MRKLLLLTVATMSLTTVAQVKKVAPREVIFTDGDLIDGDLSKPDVEYFNPACRVQHSSLIKLREEFKDKVMESAREL